MRSRTGGHSLRGLLGVHALALLLLATVALGRAHEEAQQRGDRGDVPGWVMVTVMTAALVAALLVPFREAIVNATQAALANVTGL